MTEPKEPTPADQGSTDPGPPAAAPDGGPNNRTAESNRQLLDLAADIRKTRGEVHGLRNTVIDLASTISEWGPELAETQRTLASVQGVVEQLVSAKAETDNAPLDWVRMSAEDAEREWRLLGQWVHEVLADWYEITRAQLPDCWALHRPAFLQISWLRSSHIGAYLEDSHPAQAAEWNVRWLDAALAKIAEHIPASRCRPVAGGPGEHLVDPLEAEQSRQRGPAPASGGEAYGNPYAQSAAPVPPRPSGSGAGAAGHEVIRWDYWGGYFTQAMNADVAARRQREAERKTRQRGTDDPPPADEAAGEQPDNTAP